MHARAVRIISPTHSLTYLHFQLSRFTSLSYLPIAAHGPILQSAPQQHLPPAPPPSCCPVFFCPAEALSLSRVPTELTCLYLTSGLCLLCCLTTDSFAFTFNPSQPPPLHCTQFPPFGLRSLLSVRLFKRFNPRSKAHVVFSSPFCSSALRLIGRLIALLFTMSLLRIISYMRMPEAQDVYLLRASSDQTASKSHPRTTCTSKKRPILHQPSVLADPAAAHAEHHQGQKTQLKGIETPLGFPLC